MAIASIEINHAWGSEGAEASVVYGWTATPVTTGYQASISVGGKQFFGVCVADAPNQSSSGLKRELKFKDNLLYLSYDQVWCSFNVLDDHIVNNVRVKRYVHILPDLAREVTLVPAAFQLVDNLPIIPTQFTAGSYYSGLIKTYSDAQLTAAQIITLILNSTSIKDKWTTNSFHPDQFTAPLGQPIDALGGKSLKAVLQEISDQQGLVFAQVNAPFNLMWVRKGQLDSRYPSMVSVVPPLETNPATGQNQLLTDDRITGDALSGNPTQVMILGDRNTYQVMNIPLVADWSPGWEQYWDVILFREAIYQNGKTVAPASVNNQTFPAGTPFTAIGSSAADPEQILARQLALVASLSITVAQFAQLMGESLFVDEPNFADYKLYAGKSRLDMPAELYINQILFRAFSFPVGFAITNQYGTVIPIDSLEVMDKQIGRITYDPITGEMSADPTLAADGNGLAIAHGYEVGKDLFSKINPDRFNLSEWNNAQLIWAAQEFTMDDSGEPGGKVVLFRERLIASTNLVKIIDGYGVFNAAPTKNDGVTPGFDIPAVQVGICFSGERYAFLSTPNEGGRTETMQVGGLNKELLCTYGVAGFAEVLYSDGLTADQKAAQIIAPLELLQYIYDKGGYRHALIPPFQNAMQLNPFIDKISIKLDPDSVLQEFVEYTSELPRQFYTPERDLDRNTKLLTLIPGQAELRQQAITAQQIAKALQTSQDARRQLGNAFKGYFGDGTDLSPVTIIADPPATSTLAVGTPMFGMPTSVDSSGNASNTIAVPPAQVTAKHSIFAGSVTRDGESGGAGQTVLTQSTGYPLIRVQTPVTVGQPVGQVAGKDYLSPTSTVNFVGIAQQTAMTPGDDGITALIPVQIGASTPGTQEEHPFAILKVSETQVEISNNSALLTGLDCQTTQQIFGLDQAFTVAVGSKIYLEVLFDLNGNPILANICTSFDGWRSEVAGGFPLLAGVVDNNQLPVETDTLNLEFFGFHVEHTTSLETDNENLAIAQTALAAFKNNAGRFNQFYAYCLIGFCAPSSSGASGTAMAGASAGAGFTIVQCLESHLMLQGFCQGGVPCEVPMPYSAPFLVPLPAVTITQTNSGAIVTLVLSVSGYPDALIFYSLDGAAEVQGTVLNVTAPGNHTLLAYATQTGFLQSTTASASFKI
jgi:hypothetical protein